MDLRMDSKLDNQKLGNATFLSKSKEPILEIAKEEMTTSQYNELETRFVALNRALMLLYVGNLNKMGNLQAERNSMRKIDPAIAGGIADGIAGVGAGLYVAAGAAEAERKRKEFNAEARAAVAESTVQVKELESLLIMSYNEVIDLIAQHDKTNLLLLDLFAQKAEEERLKQEKIIADNEQAKRIAIFAIASLIIGIFSGLSLTQLFEEQLTLIGMIPAVIISFVILQYTYKKSSSVCNSVQSARKFKVKAAVIAIVSLPLGLVVGLWQYTAYIIQMFNQYHPENYTFFKLWVSLFYQYWGASAAIFLGALVSLIAILFYRQTSKNLKSNHTKATSEKEE